MIKRELILCKNDDTSCTWCIINIKVKNRYCVCYTYAKPPEYTTLHKSTLEINIWDVVNNEEI